VDGLTDGCKDRGLTSDCEGHQAAAGAVWNLHILEGISVRMVMPLFTKLP